VKITGILVSGSGVPNSAGLRAARTRIVSAAPCSSSDRTAPAGDILDVPVDACHLPSRSPGRISMEALV
jgi:hypothetical protein